MDALRRAMAWLPISAIRLYQRTASRILPPVCRFQPSCSDYAIEAIQRHGVIRGGLLGVWRILRCNPFGAGGHDPVPAASDANPEEDEPALPESSAQ